MLAREGRDGAVARRPPLPATPRWAARGHRRPARRRRRVADGMPPCQHDARGVPRGGRSERGAAFLPSAARLRRGRRLEAQTRGRWCVTRLPGPACQVPACQVPGASVGCAQGAPKGGRTAPAAPRVRRRLYAARELLELRLLAAALDAVSTALRLEHPTLGHARRAHRPAYAARRPPSARPDPLAPRRHLGGSKLCAFQAVSARSSRHALRSPALPGSAPRTPSSGTAPTRRAVRGRARDRSSNPLSRSRSGMRATSGWRRACSS